MQTEKSRAFYSDIQDHHRQASLADQSHLYLTPIRPQSLLGRQPVIQPGSIVGAIIRNILQQIPDLYLVEIQSILNDIFDEGISVNSIRHYLDTRGYRIAKGQRVVPQSNPEVRRIWASGFPVLCSSIDQLIFIDETSHGRWTGYRTTGRSPRGTNVNLRFPYNKAKSKCLFGAFDRSGIFSYAVSFIAPKSDTVERFMRNCVVPHLNPYPGPNSIVIIDNAPTHNITNLSEIISSVGAVLICLPAYSPDLNPIEKWFHCYKAYWRKNRHLSLTTDEIDTAISTINNSTDWSSTITHTYIPTENGITVN